MSRSAVWIGLLLLIAGGFHLTSRTTRGASLIGMSSAPEPVTTAVPVVSAPTTPVAAPAITDAPPSPEPVAVLPASAPHAPVLAAPLPSGWREEASEREQPTLEVTNEALDGTPTRIIFQDTGQVYELNCDHEVNVLQLPAGEYDYELRASRYERVGEPDQYGRFRCRRFRKYSITIVNVEDSPYRQRHEDFGDPR